MSGLTEGMTFPDFSFQNSDGETLSFDQCRKGMSVVVIAMKETGLIQDIQRHYEQFETNAVQVFAITDKPQKALSFPVVSDADQKIRNMLFWKEDDPYMLFILDENGKITRVVRTSEPADLPDAMKILQMIEEDRHPSVPAELLADILDAYPYEIVYVNRRHVVTYMNAAAKRRYGDRVKIGNSLFNCHNERSRDKIRAFLKRADNGENEMFEVYNGKTGEREFFVPVRNRQGEVTGYFERHEAPWDREHADQPVGDYWKNRAA